MSARRGVLAALAAATLGCASTGTGTGRPGSTEPPIKPAGSLQVMTFNIRFGTAPDGDDSWPKRRVLALRVIREAGPAILGLQEALRFQLDEIERAMPMFGEVGVGRDDGAQAGEYAAILYDRHRLKVLAEGRFWLSDTPEVPGSMTWGNRYPRIVTWARFLDRTTSQTFIVYNTHWDHESRTARENGARLMRERIAARPEPQEPILVLGDLNCAEHDPAFRLLAPPLPPEAKEEEHGGDASTEAVELVDTFRTVYSLGVTGIGTYHAFRGGRDGPKIDFILVAPLGASRWRRPSRGDKEWRVLEADIVHASEGGHYPSDHFPVTARLVISDVEVPVMRALSHSDLEKAAAEADQSQVRGSDQPRR